MRAIASIALTAFFGIASARIVGLAAPSIIAPNSEITVTLITENYIQSVADISAAFSLSTASTTNYLGAPYLGSFYLGPDKSNIVANVTLTVNTPNDLTGIRFLNGAVTSLYGASYGPVTVIFHVPVSPGTTTSDTLNSDVGGINSCSTTDTASASGGTTSAGSGNTSRDATCFPNTDDGNVQTLIQSTQIAITSLINDVVQASNATALADLAKVEGSLGQVIQMVVPQPDGCASIPAQPWPPLTPSDSQVRLMQILDSAQGALQAISAAILKCDVAAAKSIICQVQKLVDDAGAYWSN